MEDWMSTRIKNASGTTKLEVEKMKKFCRENKEYKDNERSLIYEILMSGKSSDELIEGLKEEEEKALENSYNDGSKEIVVQLKFDSLKEACEYFGKDYGVVWARIRRSGWSLEEALEIEKRERYGNKLIFNGVEYPSLAALAKDYNLDYNKLKQRIRRGYSILEAVTGIKASKKIKYKDYEPMSIMDLCNSKGLYMYEVMCKINDGLPIDDIVEGELERKELEKYV